MLYSMTRQHVTCEFLIAACCGQTLVILPHNHHTMSLVDWLNTSRATVATEGLSPEKSSRP
jgi:hypothetical protein